MVTKQDENDPRMDDLIRKLAVGTLVAASIAEVMSVVASKMQKGRGSTAKDWRRMNVWEP